MDPKLFFVVLFSGNLCVVILLLAYRKENFEPALRDHLTAQLFMTLAYPFGAARLLTDFPLFPILNSAIMILGVYYEVRALAGLVGFGGDRPKRHLFLSVLVALAVYVSTAIYTANAVIRVTSLAIAMIILMLPVTFIVLRKKDNSRIRIIIGVYFLLLMVAYLFRVYDAMRLGNKFVIFGQSPGETVMLASMYVYQILGGVGILLLSKEKEDVRLVRLAFYDEATGALNHAGTVEKIGGSLERCSIENKSFCVGLLDIDNVSGLNQRFGVETGDMIISKYVAKVLDHIGNKGLVGRMGGGELLVFIQGVDDSTADALAMELISIPSKDHIGEVRYTASAGFVVFDNPAGRRISFNVARAACADALRDAKHNGPGSRVVANR